MKRSILYSFIIMAMFITAASAQSKSDKAEARSKRSIAETITAFENAWNVHDADAFADQFAKDADFTNVVGISARGRNDIKSLHAPMFAARFKNSKLTVSDVKIRILRPDVAAADVLWSMTGASDAAGNPRPERKGLINAILMPENGKWRLKVMHNMELPNVPAAR